MRKSKGGDEINTPTSGTKLLRAGTFIQLHNKKELIGNFS